MKCANHLEKDALIVCNHCGKSICSECQVQLKGEAYCKDCITSKRGEGKKAEHSPVLAAILSFIIAGLGQIYNGQVGKGLLIFFTAWLILPWMIGIFDAYKTAKAIKEGKVIIRKRPGCMMAAVIGIAVFFFGIFFLGMLAAIAIPNFLKARLEANETAAETTLKTISVAIEAYRAGHEGDYPLDEESLMGSAYPYLPIAYNNTVGHGYVFSEDFQADGYKVIATPAECGVTGVNIFTIQTGGVLTAQECGRKKEGL
jgi:Tfp pilus assembly protein PilE